MKGRPLARRSEATLLRDAALHAAQEREGRNRLLVDIAEIDARKAYRQAGYDSIHSYCIHELRLTKKAAFHRIHVARVAGRFPSVLLALAGGRLHMSGVGMLATHLTDQNAEELVELTVNRSKQEIQEILAERFPRPELFTSASLAENGLDLAVCHRRYASQSVSSPQRPPEGVASTVQGPLGPAAASLESMDSSLQRPPEGVPPTSSDTAPMTINGHRTLPPPRFPLRVSLRRETHEKIRHAQELLGHQVPSGDVAEILDRALDELIRGLEKRKFAATDKPRARASVRARDPRYIPAHVRRAVRERDGGRCTFVSDKGTRCPARRRLEFDHVLPVALGGQSVVANVRLLCQAHNQYLAERVYGEKFMEDRRREASNSRERAPGS